MGQIIQTVLTSIEQAQTDLIFRNLVAWNVLNGIYILNNWTKIEDHCRGEADETAAAQQ